MSTFVINLFSFHHQHVSKMKEILKSNTIEETCQQLLHNSVMQTATFAFQISGNNVLKPVNKDSPIDTYGLLIRSLCVHNDKNGVLYYRTELGAAQCPIEYRISIFYILVGYLYVL